MATGGKVSKTAKRSTVKPGAKDDRTVAIQAANSGETNVMYPIKGAVAAYVRHPLKGTTPHLRTDRPEFAEMLKELSELGLGARLQRELGEFRDKYDAQWGNILEKLQADNVFGDRPSDDSAEAADAEAN
jgi:hypothetical protein